MLGRAIAIAAQAFAEKKDKGGKPYIEHCLRVMYGLHTDDEELKCAAVLHDLVEDTKWTLEDLVASGMSLRVCHIVGLLTHDKKKMDYDTYIKIISLDKDATRIKLSDLKDNSDITRLKGLTKKDFDRMEKYHRSFIYLSKI